MILNSFFPLAAQASFLLFSMCFAGQVYAQYKCADGKGAISYQQVPCPQGHKETELGLRYESAPTQEAPTRSLEKTAKTSTAGVRLAPSGRPCKTAAEYEEAKRQLAKPKQKPAAGSDPSMEALAESLFGGLDKKLAAEMAACL